MTDIVVRQEEIRVKICLKMRFKKLRSFKVNFIFVRIKKLYIRIFIECLCKLKQCV